MTIFTADQLSDDQFARDVALRYREANHFTTRCEDGPRWFSFAWEAIHDARRRGATLEFIPPQPGRLRRLR